MNQVMIRELTEHALQACMFETITPSVIVEGTDGTGRVEIPLCFSEKFAELIVNTCIDVVCESDPSTKMILHEPYRTIVANIQEHFWNEE